MGNDIERPRRTLVRFRLPAAAGLLASLCAFAQTTPMPPPGKLTTLFGFSVNGPTGGRPDGGLVLNIDGNFYGTTTVGSCCGTIYRITSGGDLTTIYSFTGGVSGGQTPRGSMTRDNDGNLYGTTDGSTGLNPTAYKITPGGVFTSFGNLPGSRPNGLVFARDGNLYGATSSGGPGQSGVFFRITTAGVVTSLHVFTGRDNTDVGPTALVQGNDDAFYGANRGAILRITMDGVVSVIFKPPPVGNGPSNVWDGLNAPASGLVLAGDGNFYGAADDGIFRVTPDGNFKRLFKYTDVGLMGNSNTSVIHDNRAALILGGDGNLYGTNSPGDSVYQITTSAGFKLIYKFATGGTEGSVPSVLTAGPDGLYGTTGNSGPGRPLGSGTVFKIEYAGSGTGGTMR